MDQAESSPSPGQPGKGEPERRTGQPAPGPPPEVAAGTGGIPEPAPLDDTPLSALRLEHPVIAGYDGSASSRNALAYAAGVSRRLGRPLLVVYVCSSGEFSADALVIGAPTHIWHRVAGSVSGWLARHARCPVIVVP